MHPRVDQCRSFVQVSDFMNDEEGIEQLCRLAACWLFGLPGSLQLRATVEAYNQAAADYIAPCEDQVQVRCFCGCS